MTPEERMKQVAERLVNEYRETDEGMAIDPAVIRQIIAADLDVAAGAFSVMVRAAAEVPLPIWGLLLVVSEAYKLETDGDDSLVLKLSDAARKAGVELPNARFVSQPDDDDSGTSGGNAADDDGRLTILEMAREDVLAGDAFRMVRLFSVDRISPEILEKSLGRFTVAFSIDDTRPVWRIPEVRRFLASLHTKLPYFPLYMDLDPRLQQHLSYYGGLADPDAVEDLEDGTSRIDLDHPSVVSKVRESVLGIREACRILNLDFQHHANQVLQVYDNDPRERLFGDLTN